MLWQTIYYKLLQPIISWWHIIDFVCTNPVYLPTNLYSSTVGGCEAQFHCLHSVSCHLNSVTQFRNICCLQLMTSQNRLFIPAGHPSMLMCWGHTAGLLISVEKNAGSFTLQVFVNYILYQIDEWKWWLWMVQGICVKGWVDR